MELLPTRLSEVQGIYLLTKTCFHQQCPYTKLKNTFTLSSAVNACTRIMTTCDSPKRRHFKLVAESHASFVNCLKQVSTYTEGYNHLSECNIVETIERILIVFGTSTKSC
jgi:hypothetical protein